MAIGIESIFLRTYRYDPTRESSIIPGYVLDFRPPRGRVKQTRGGDRMGGVIVVVYIGGWLLGFAVAMSIWKR